MYTVAGILVPARGHVMTDYLVKPIPHYVINAFEGFKKRFEKKYEG